MPTLSDRSRMPVLVVLMSTVTMRVAVAVTGGRSVRQQVQKHIAQQPTHREGGHYVEG